MQIGIGGAAGNSFGPRGVDFDGDGDGDGDGETGAHRPTDTTPRRVVSDHQRLREEVMNDDQMNHLMLVAVDLGLVLTTLGVGVTLGAAL